MKKHRWIAYGLVLLALLGLWSLQVWQTVQALQGSVYQVVSQSVSLSHSDLSQRLSLRVMALRLSFASLPVQGSLAGGLDALERQDGDAAYFVARADGRVLDSAEKTQAVQLTEEQRARVRESGYALLGTQGAIPGVDYLLAADAPSGEDGYVLEGYTAAALAEMLRGGMRLPADGLALYDASGYRMLDLTPGDLEYEDILSLDYAALDYVLGQETIHVAPLGQNMRFMAFFPVPQTGGWFLGGIVEMGGPGSLYRNVLDASFHILAMLVLLFIALMAVDIVRRSREHLLVSRERNIDMLSGLHNVDGMDRCVPTFLQESSDRPYCFVCINIVMFHRFNTMFGYQTGDALIRTIGGVLNDRYACAARVDGDTFAFFVPGEQNLDRRIERDLQDGIRESLGAEYLPMIGFSYGIYPLVSRDVPFREMLDGAQLALRAAKQMPEQRVAVFDAAMRERVMQRQSIELNMLHALSREEFAIYVQPLFSLSHQAFIGGEALIRWPSEQMGFLAPDAFIPLFEENGFIVELDLYVLRKVLETLRDAIERGANVTPVSVNQSRVTLMFPNYLSRLKALALEFDSLLTMVRLEITETVLENDSGRAMRVIEEIRDLGFSIALDDFGVGYSSLNTLRNLKVDVLKIDRGFLQQSHDEARGRLIIKNIINMARDLHIHIVCEGVETQEQAEFLRRIGCDDAQGFFYARPMPVDRYLAEFCQIEEEPNKGG